MCNPRTPVNGATLGPLLQSTRIPEPLMRQFCVNNRTITTTQSRMLLFVQCGNGPSEESVYTAADDRTGHVVHGPKLLR